MQKLYRRVFVFDGEDGGVGNRLMNALMDGHAHRVMEQLIALDPLNFSEELVDDESHIPPEFTGLLEVGEYRLGWDQHPKGLDLLVLEKIHHVKGGTQVVTLLPVGPPESKEADHV